MEYWEITKDRAEKTLPVWQQYIATVKINGKLPADLDTLISGFMPLVTARVTAQDNLDTAFRAVQSALLVMKTLGLRVAGMIESQLDEDVHLMDKLERLRRVAPRTASTILKRATELVPIWKQANAALAAAVPALPPLVKPIQGVGHTVAMLETLLATTYNALVKTMNDKQELLDKAREDLREHDAAVDRLNKNWYKYVKEAYEPSDDVYEQLAGIPTEPSTPAPEVIEIDAVTQGGEEGLQALVSYLPGGGAHATTKKIKWGVAGADTGTPHDAPLDASGNALGPFAVGNVVTIIAEVGNSAGTRTTAPRTITIAVPIE